MFIQLGLTLTANTVLFSNIYVTISVQLHNLHEEDDTTIKNKDRKKYVNKKKSWNLQIDFAIDQLVWDPKFLTQTNKTKTLNVIFPELSPNTMSNTIDKDIIITFWTVNNPYPCHPYMFVTEIYSSKFTVMSFWVPALQTPAKNGIPKKCLDMSLPYLQLLALLMNRLLHGMLLWNLTCLEWLFYCTLHNSYLINLL